MSVADAKRMLMWKVVDQVLAEANLDPEVVELVANARSAYEMVQGMALLLRGSADEQRTRNYVKVEMQGLTPPFDRAYVELTRPGGQTSHELRTRLRLRLVQVRSALAEQGGAGQMTEEACAGMIAGIDADLAAESSGVTTDDE